MIMFLILGTLDCKFCIESKKLLDSQHLKYLYYDLTLKYGTEWRSIFNELKSLLKSQKTIPIIFRIKTNDSKIEPSVPESFTVEDLLKEWDFVGSYFDLEDLMDDLDISIDNDY
jgi:glutaredoxin